MLSESREQILFVNWMRKNYPEHKIFAIPNGGSRNPSEAQRMKMEGVTAGVPDLMIPSLRMFIEMKRLVGGKISKEQQQMIEYLRQCGYVAVVCAGAEQAKVAVNFTLSLKN